VAHLRPQSKTILGVVLIWPERGCVADQPQPLPPCCGWRFAHSRAPKHPKLGHCPILGVVSFCLEFRVHAAFGPPKGGTPNLKMSHYPILGIDLEKIIAKARKAVAKREQ
jgi:hypothetical protein